MAVCRVVYSRQFLHDVGSGVHRPAVFPAADMDLAELFPTQPPPTYSAEDFRTVTFFDRPIGASLAATSDLPFRQHNWFKWLDE